MGYLEMRLGIREQAVLLMVLVGESLAEQGRVADIPRPSLAVRKGFVGGVIQSFAGARDMSNLEVVDLDVEEPVVPLQLVDVTKSEIDMIADEETTSPPPSPKPEATRAVNSTPGNSTTANNSTKAEDCDDMPKSAGAAQKDKDDAVKNAAAAMGIKSLP